LRDDQGIIQNFSVKINTIATSLYLPASYCSFRILRQAQKIERMEHGKIAFFGRSDGCQEHQNKDIP
jgi:hypothetical protein